MSVYLEINKESLLAAVSGWDNSSRDNGPLWAVSSIRIDNSIAGWNSNGRQEARVGLRGVRLVLVLMTMGVRHRWSMMCVNDDWWRMVWRSLTLSNNTFRVVRLQKTSFDIWHSNLQIICTLKRSAGWQKIAKYFTEKCFKRTNFIQFTNLFLPYK